MRNRGWGLLLLVLAAIYATLVLRSPFGGFHQHLALAGTPRRFAATVVRAGRADARGALWLDNLFVLSWVLTVPRLLRAGLDRWAPERRRMFGFWSHTPRVALWAAALDLVENVVSLAVVGKPLPLSGLTLLIEVIAWTKMVLYAVALAGIAGLVVGPLLAPFVRPFMRRVFSRLDHLVGTHPPSVPDAGQAAPVAAAPGERIGISLSGGGVRASSVAIGALRELDAPRQDGPSLFQRSRWLVAVSGGACAAGGWRISRRPGAAIPPVPIPERDGLFDADQPWAATVRARQGVLRNGFLSVAGALLNTFVRSAAVLATVLAMAFVVGAGVGRFVRTRAIHPWFPFADASREGLLTLRDLVPVRLVLPGGVLVVVALGALGLSFTRGDLARRARTIRVAGLAAVVGLLLLLVLVAVPLSVLYGRRVLRALPAVEHADEGAAVLAALVAAGVVCAVVGILAARVKRPWMRLGGAALAVGMVLFAGKSADTHARDMEGWFFEWEVPFTELRVPVVAVAAAWLLIGEGFAAHHRTLTGMYRKRLAAAYAPRDGLAAPLPPLAYSAEPLWPAYQQAGGPELIVVASAHSSARSFGGLKGHGFTFSPHRVTLHDRPGGTSAFAPAHAYPRGSWWDGYHRGWLVSRSMALRGAAFATPIGRDGLETTSSLLAALNLRLGEWVPNPRYQRWFVDTNTSPRVHAGYLLKELFGRYHPHRDAFVYVTDGGHRENLGLVELLRERPDVAICIDASGDTSGTLQPLRDAIALAETELEVRIDLDVGHAGGHHGDLPRDCAACGTILYPAEMGAGVGTLLYGRHGVRPTDGHDQLVAHGEQVGARIADLFDRVSFDGVNP